MYMTRLVGRYGPVLGIVIVIAAAYYAPASAVADTSQSAATAFEFALLGDNPYPPEHIPKFERLIDDVNADPDLRWVIHVGDIRSTPRSPCSDEVIRGRFELYQRFDAPFIFTPGDNDWFDCGTAAGGSFDEAERLAFLRRTFYPAADRTTGGRPFGVESQSADPRFQAFVENAMWVRDGIVFATIHLIPIFGRVSTELARMQAELMDAALVWIERAFARAAELDSPGLFLAMQADPWVVSGLPLVVGQLCVLCLEPRPGLERLYEPLAEATMAFGRPVVLAVGDTHVFRVDKPMLAPGTSLPVDNFTRVEVFGYPRVHWVHVTVDRDDPEVFTFRQRVIAENIDRD